MFAVKCFIGDRFIGYLKSFNKSHILIVTCKLEDSLHFEDFGYFVDIFPFLPQNYTYVVIDYDICNLTGVYYDV